MVVGTWQRLLGALAIGAVGASLLSGGCASSASSQNVAVCPASQTLCGSTCVNTGSDGDNCGACGKTCAPLVCSTGACATSCAGGTTACGSSCVDLQVDPSHCGACGVTCPTGDGCVGGHCGPACGERSVLCSTDAGPTCVDTQSDQANCGSCGSACPAGQACTGGVCNATCLPGQTLCVIGGRPLYCSNTQTDAANCGACGAACASGQACTRGLCKASCPTYETLCSADGGPACVNTVSDSDNCGACGKTCGPLGICSGSACLPSSVLDMLGYWRFDDGSGTTAADSSGNGLSGTLVNSPSWVAGLHGGALSFAGTSQYVDIPFPNDAKGQGSGLFIPQGNQTFAMWIKSTASPVSAMQIVWGNTWGAGCDRMITGAGSGMLQYYVWDTVVITGKTVVNDGAWHQVVYVLDESAGELAYVDGVLDASSTAATMNCGVGCSGFNWASDYYIGTSGAGCAGGQYFAGTIDEVMFWTHPLSATQVASLYAATK
jgi:hypothetical protein